MHKKEKKTNQKYKETGCNCWEVCLQIMWSCYLRSFHVKISIKIIRKALILSYKWSKLFKKL
jgi:hypothetical protein